ncbi:MAG: hypothetical protein ACOYOI_10105, partial [Chthoniobacterales bacterium]
KSEIVNENSEIIKKMAGLREVKESSKGSGLKLTASKAECWLDIDSSIAKEYVSELSSKADRQEQIIKQLESRLANKSYVANAPEQVVTQTKQQLQEASELLDSIKAEAERFKA